MWNYVTKTIQGALKMTSNLDQTGWFLVGIAVLLIGMFCLKGYGSRSNY